MSKDEKQDDNKVQFLQVGVDIYNGYKISKDGLSREEDVEVMKGIDEERKNYSAGAKLREAILGQKDDKHV